MLILRWALNIANIHISNLGEDMGKKACQHFNTMFPRPFVPPAWRVPRASPWTRLSWWLDKCQKNNSSSRQKIVFWVTTEGNFSSDSRKLPARLTERTLSPVYVMAPTHPYLIQDQKGDCPSNLVRGPLARSRSIFPRARQLPQRFQTWCWTQETKGNMQRKRRFHVASLAMC